MYENSLQTTSPNLQKHQASGGSLLRYHGESDFGIPTASSVHFQSVRRTMYPRASLIDGGTMLSDEYVIRGASHCAAKFGASGTRRRILTVRIDRFENGVAPGTLDVAVLLSEHARNEQVCA